MFLQHAVQFYKIKRWQDPSRLCPTPSMPTLSFGNYTSQSAMSMVDSSDDEAFEITCTRWMNNWFAAIDLPDPNDPDDWNPINYPLRFLDDFEEREEIIRLLSSTPFYHRFLRRAFDHLKYLHRIEEDLSRLHDNPPTGFTHQQVESFRSTSSIAGGLSGDISWIIRSHRVLFNRWGIRFNDSHLRPTHLVQTRNHDQLFLVNPHRLRFHIFSIVIDDIILTWQDFYHHIPAEREFRMKRFEVNHLIIKAVSLRLAIDLLI